ncbi:sugar ABC transporter permease protein [Thermoclostridium stercorarium subsp. stercorarium DSM 8532]|jgi:putative aldouronate transport system permease protein|uniref:Sugar ABC transporter permease protein n=3 Tax=Thermoclostridium stercorarium TaxID=1510 RepID=L7VTK9_THES1|nr:carbohydrate ABC transporter permease [Thermoclostridium stercorarium]AGC69676.1 sugar ABC transporter permease protein [Thermoclostridium stercorarium subsp. stercorarium DSM 8532]AGI40629.1 ABC transporter permease subunit [Thermoclostridium stercorarium subsp. stercorarium DSM 8532]ANW99897.1 ABC transporter permease [Thermoclostridium stercorarium subsp. thermolacticum DSM 2910]ANX02522.1 ABC transporter permease [Thermoclostridium stercorarium subsp. leptospartum DSM 9219]UZQ85615.1 ca
MHRSKLNKFTVADFIMIVIIVLLCLTCVLPFVHLLSKSISDNAYVLAKKVYFLPKGINFEAYIAIFRDGQLTHSMLYSAMVTVIFTVLGLITTVMAAWPLSRRRLKGRVFFTFVIMFTMYFGAGLIPTYLLYSKLGLLNTMWVLILPLIFAPYNFLIMKTYFQSNIPDSLEESAYLDGASNTQILIKIILPISKPILATIALFLAVGRWNAYEDSKFFITKKSLHMIQYLLSMMVLTASESEKISISEASLVTTTPEVIQAAAVMFVSIPILCIYPFVQKYFVKGIMIGAIKG